ncbi:MAG: prepilin-type N-terminal cleavage/methylation domain-containing protein [Deltaproteobacteria bacterium]|nr:prepilin-type N-terminal cleavage/methylation domain-containing protein [Deltaproteobacteria bacterium]
MENHQKIYGNAGFTLLELMVALGLTALLSLVAFTALNLSLKGVRRGQFAAEQLQELRVGRTILERSLRSGVRGVPGKSLYFLGEPHQVRFLTVLPLEAHSLGGIYHWRPLLGQDEAGRGVLAVEQVNSRDWQENPEVVEIRQIILRGVTALTFSYGRGGEEKEAWDAEKEKHLPDWVRVKLGLVGQESQEWLIPIYVAENKAGPSGPR